MTTEIVLKALENANKKRKISGATIHTDQGSNTLVPYIQIEHKN